ncbi:hypothetical protein [Staphylococcus equorum]|uniref:hypothetical protein n=1 Tax=Staphylococcus equorum TaxID=246432 RepID=UPI000D1C2A0A|nr:hypothetical protein [Staphylococcus equorum]PTE81483.1 hypothetical protein BUY85_04325 [Staphylococcus equorum]QPS99831.1 hypothetical protein I6G41_01855 [Staphylococcus equorum]
MNNIVGDERTKDDESAQWYIDVLTVNTKTSIQTLYTYGRGASDAMFCAQGGQLIYPSWKQVLSQFNNMH